MDQPTQELHLVISDSRKLPDKRVQNSRKSELAVGGHPERWPTVAMSGGRSHPVSPGEIARAIHPEGAIRNAIPIAIAAYQGRPKWTMAMPHR